MYLVNRFQGRPKFPKKAMFFGFIGSDGKAFPGIWVEGTMDAAQYKSILIRKVFLILDATYGKGNYIWTQDGASVHMANTILTYLCSVQPWGAMGASPNAPLSRVRTGVHK